MATLQLRLAYACGHVCGFGDIHPVIGAGLLCACDWMDVASLLDARSPRLGVGRFAQPDSLTQQGGAACVFPRQFDIITAKMPIGRGLAIDGPA